MSISLIRILNNILSLLWCTTAFLLLLCTTPCFPGVHQRQVFFLVHYFLLPRSAPATVFLYGTPFSPVFSFFECTTAFLLLLCTTPFFPGVHQPLFFALVHHFQSSPNLCVNSSFSYIELFMLLLSSIMYSGWY